MPRPEKKEIICRECGKPFFAVYDRGDHPMCKRCIERHYKREHEGLEAKLERNARKRAEKSGKELARIETEARASKMTYGQYVAKTGK